jgi:dTDP-4-amino-4,6-dideoxygalactose transaminase
LLEIASKHGLRVIEDACQAHGAEYKGRKAGNLGDAAAFSFYYSKNLGAYGEGGFISTNNDELASKMRMLRDHGSGVRYHHDLIGFNARLDEVQAVVLRAKLPYLAKWNEQRREHARLYGELLKDTPAKTPVELPGNTPVYHLYVISVPKRDELQAALREQGIFTGIHYPIPLHLQKAMEYLGYKQGDLPVTERIVKEILSLPMYAEIQTSQIDHVVGQIKEFLTGTA